FFQKNGARVANQQVLYKHTYVRNETEIELPFPIVAKPNREGSTIGITFAENKEALLDGIDAAFQHDETVLLEEYIAGTEVTVAVMGNQGEEIALPVVEIVPKNKYYDYEAKYSAGG